MLLDKFVETLMGQDNEAVQNFIECIDDHLNELFDNDEEQMGHWSAEYADWYYETQESDSTDEEDDYLRSIKYDMPKSKWAEIWKDYYKTYFIDEGVA